MTAPWNGLPDQPERSGWHWLKHSNGNYPQPFEWNPDTRQWEVDIDDEGFPEEMADSGYQYICRCPDPSELAQMRKGERERVITDALPKILVDLSELPDRTSPDNAPDLLMATAHEVEMIVQENIRNLPDEEGKKS